MPSQSFGKRLKELREAAGLTQPELAARAGMNRFGVAKLEQEQREPTWATVQAVAKALGVGCAAFEGTGVTDQAADAQPPKRTPRKAGQADAEAPPAKKGRGKKK